MMRKTKLLFNQFLSYFLIILFVITQSLVAMERDDYDKQSRFFKTFSEKNAWDRNRADGGGETLNQHLFLHHVGVSDNTTHDRILRQNEEPIRSKVDAVQLMCGICNGYT